ncbi:uncharacterized protein LOC134272248 isoform X2 [Saccostrea cucullata]|uniref:uncharacterized protein LOC134272248 isoform X2 n=1 Tax=Saccostrea cuccullata TaxID=36930 RepID=UPI002ED47B77
MARNKALIADLFSSALGLVFCCIATVTPGFFINQERRESIFYCHYKEYGSDSWSTNTYVAYDKEHDTNGYSQLSMLGLQLESLITVVLGGFGWLILLSNIMKKAPIPSMFLTGGIFLLVAVSEFAVLVICISVNLREIAYVSNPRNSHYNLEDLSVEVPYSLILAGFGIILILIAVVRIFIRNKRYQLSTEIHHEMSFEPRSNIREFIIVSQHLRGEDERCITEDRV